MVGLRIIFISANFYKKGQAIYIYIVEPKYRWNDYWNDKNAVTDFEDILTNLIK